VRDRGTRRRRVERDAGRVSSVAADRCVDLPGARARPAAHESEVRPLKRTFTDELLQALVRGFRPGDDHQPRRVAIQAVDDAGPLRVAAGDLAGEGVDERPARVTRTGVHDEAGRLVDHEQVLVLQHDLRLRRRRNDGRGHGFRELDLLAACEPVALRACDTVDERPRLDRPLRRAARAQLRREESVEPLARRRLGDLHRAATSSVRRGFFGARSAATRAASRIATPTTMKLSARLNAGHHFRSTKSVT
jgi:hypothetical protein